MKELFHAIVDRLPPPVGDLNAPARALLYDSWCVGCGNLAFDPAKAWAVSHRRHYLHRCHCHHGIAAAAGSSSSAAAAAAAPSPLHPRRYDDFRGVVSLVCVKDGVLRPKDPLFFMHRGIQAEVQDLGVVTPTRHAVTELRAGQVGFVVTGVRGASDARVGETICHLAAKDSVQRLPGFQNMKPMVCMCTLGRTRCGLMRCATQVFASLYPADMSDYSELHRAVERLTLNDASVSVARESSGALGEPCHRLLVLWRRRSAIVCWRRHGLALRLFGAAAHGRVPPAAAARV